MLHAPGGADGANNVWRMTQPLYGKTTVGSQFRDLFEAVVCSESTLRMARGHYEPCDYYGKTEKILALHHVDDGRIVAGHEALTWLLIHLS